VPNFRRIHAHHRGFLRIIADYSPLRSRDSRVASANAVSERRMSGIAIALLKMNVARSYLFSEEAAMTINEGTWDRVIRVVIGFALGYVAWTTWPTEASFLSQTGVVSVVSLVIAMIAFVTGVIGSCPMYNVFGVSTIKRISA
jgi:hypothetical protein